MKLPFRFFYVLFLNIIYLSFMAFVAYKVWTKEVPIYFVIVIILMVLKLPEMLTAYSRYSEEDDNFTIDLSLRPAVNHDVTPEYIAEVLNNKKVIQVIKNDLMKTGQIGYREEWRLALISPERSLLENILPTRTAVMHSTGYPWSDNIAITNGKVQPLGLSKWGYALSTKLNRGEFINIKAIQVEDDPEVAKHQCLSLAGFLREEGFPLKESYSDGDPLTADRGGTIVIDKGKVIVIYPRYFVQRRVIDDEGNLVDLGIDENFSHDLLFVIRLEPSASRELIKRVSKRGYIPVVRYRSIPYASEFMLPALDTPMSANGWADLYIDTRGKAKLFIARKKTDAEWYEMMNRLKQLFQNELARKDFRLLDLTKNRAQLNQYLSRKQIILEDYFFIQDCQLF